MGNKPDPRSVLSFPTGSKPCQAPPLWEVCGPETPSSHTVSGLGSQGAAQTAGLGHMTMPSCPRIFLHSASPLKALKQSPKNYRLLKPQECRPIAGNHSSILLSSQNTKTLRHQGKEGSCREERRTRLRDPPRTHTPQPVSQPPPSLLPAGPRHPAISLPTSHFTFQSKCCCVSGNQEESSVVRPPTGGKSL